RLAESTGLPVKETADHFWAQATLDSLVSAHGVLRTTATSLWKIGSDIRLMGCGPVAGIGEIALPAVQPGSSIMPGKVNPVIVEAAIMVAAQVMGNHVAITVGGQWGQLDLNTMLPLIARNLLESVHLLASVSRVLAAKAVAGLVANAETCREQVERSPSLATALNPLI